LITGVNVPKAYHKAYGIFAKEKEGCLEIIAVVVDKLLQVSQAYYWFFVAT